MPTRVAFQTAVRAAAVDLIEAYAADVGLTIQVYRARPRSIHPPTAFIDRMRETLTDYVGTIRQRTVQADVTVLHGLFDSGDAVDQRDRFVDGFADWVAERYHAAGANTLLAVTSLVDDATYRPDWVPPAEQRDYFATVITLEGFAAT